MLCALQQFDCAANNLHRGTLHDRSILLSLILNEAIAFVGQAISKRAHFFKGAADRRAHWIGDRIFALAAKAAAVCLRDRRSLL
jgi:hypothetical protein